VKHCRTDEAIAELEHGGAGSSDIGKRFAYGCKWCDKTVVG